MTLGNFLERIVGVRRQTLEAARRAVPLAKMEQRASEASPTRDFAAALSGSGIRVIAELKKASPSRGLLHAAYNPAVLAPSLEKAGAVALSVLTEPTFFQGSLEDLQVVRKLCGLPLLRKDFLFDPYQLYEARAAGADAFLLVTAILSLAELRSLIALGRQLGMAALVEVHSEEELALALAAGAEIIGVNNRDLRTFAVSLQTSLTLGGKIPDGCVAVSESGLHSREELLRLQEAGFDAFLVGEHLMQSTNPAQALRHLLEGMDD